MFTLHHYIHITSSHNNTSLLKPYIHITSLLKHYIHITSLLKHYIHITSLHSHYIITFTLHHHMTLSHLADAAIHSDSKWLQTQATEEELGAAFGPLARGSLIWVCVHRASNPVPLGLGTRLHSPTVTRCGEADKVTEPCLQRGNRFPHASSYLIRGMDV